MKSLLSSSSFSGSFFKESKSPKKVNDGTEQIGPEKTGTLLKRGEYHKNWLARTFILKNNELFYLKSSTDVKRRGTIPLDPNWTVEHLEIQGKDFAFVIKNPYGGRSFYCVAEDEETRKEWVDAINETISCLDQNTKSEQDPSTNSQTYDISNSTVKLEDFEQKSVLGKGTYGRVLLVRHKSTGEVFAMKVLRKSAIVLANQVDNIKSELQILQQVNCPFIVKLHHAFQTEGEVYFVLNFIRGGDLFYRLKKEGFFSEDRARLYSAEIFVALKYLHEKNIIYRDLAPENILLDDDGHIVLTDFGLSKQQVGKASGAHSFCGTPEYLAPEVLQKKPYGQLADWWSFGALIYEMLTGLPPFYSKNRNVMNQKILKGELDFPTTVSNTTKDFLSSLLKRNPNERLGAGLLGLEEISKHPFYESLNWTKVQNKEYVPVYKPDIADKFDTSHFDPEFTSSSYTPGEVSQSELESIATEKFEGFTSQ
eukprot:c11969_g1_i1.p1 GENE.c11969_g1_i1~~c11969_g1_i1.p1  ORF type:complete len:481 (+),score=177.81 c11969_g1_i1:19-1461(+)